MALLDLPLELLEFIIQESIPESIENVALSCRALHTASKPFLEGHNHLRKRYRHFAFSQYTWDEPRGTGEGHWDSVTTETGIQVAGTLGLIEEIVRNPIISRYIMKADLRQNDEWDIVPRAVDAAPTDPSEDGEHHFHFFKHGDTVSGLRRLLHESPYITEAGGDLESWLHEILEGLGQYADAFLLTLLPNARELALPDNSLARSRFITEGNITFYARHSIWPILDAIVRRANDPTIADASLSRLETLLPSGSGYYGKNLMTDKTPIFAIGSLREAFVHRCGGVSTEFGHLFHPEYTEYSPLLEKLELVYCSFISREMRELLSRMPKLKYLHYAHDPEPNDRGINQNSWDIINTIMECVGETLQDLSLWMMMSWNTAGQVLTGMKGFKRLKSLHIDGFMLLGSDFSCYNMYHRSTSGISEPVNVRALDLFPRSLEKVHFQFQGIKPTEKGEFQLRKCLQVFFEGYVEERQDKLPNLKEVIIEICEANMSPGLKEELELMGITVIMAPQCQPPAYVVDFSKRPGVGDKYLELHDLRYNTISS